MGTAVFPSMERLIRFLKNNLFIQSIISWAATKIPFILEHNLGKYQAIKKALYLTALDGTSGDYLEFGVFTGSSFICALRAYRRLRSLYPGTTAFYGFDSFEGFGAVSEHDRHPFYRSDVFKTDAHRIIREIKKKSRGLSVQIIPGFFDQTLRGKNCRSNFGIGRIRCILIDCDLKDPTTLALDFSASGLQVGTIIIFDDFFSFKGDSTKGVAGAFFEFCQKNPHMCFRRIFDYGYGGTAYIVSEMRK